jgi:hypothetical protein
VKVFAEVAENHHNSHFVPYNIEAGSVGRDLEAQPKYIEKYICCNNPECYLLLQEEIDKKDQRENCLLYGFLFFLLVGIIAVTMLMVP